MGGERRDLEGTPYSVDGSQVSRLMELVERVQQMRAGGRLSPEVLHRIRKFFRIKSIYHSNAIEGNLLDVGETRQVVELGMTLTGKPLKDQAEARNLAHALDFLEELVSDPTIAIGEAEVRQIHQLVLQGIDDDNAGQYRKVPVEISGSAYLPPGPESVAAQMEDMGSWLREISVPHEAQASLEGLLGAAAAHTWLATIHPFIDGNGRVARMLMNLILMRYTFPIAIITKEDRLRYYDALEASQATDLTSFVELVGETIHESLEEYELAAQEQRQQQEWATSLATRFTAPERTRAENEYEIWRAAMDLLRSYVRQTAEMIDTSAMLARIYFKDFGELPFEKYLSLRAGESAKRTWFFRVDFVRGDDAARYLFFFGAPSGPMRAACDVTLHVAREDPPGSFHYERLATLTAQNLPDLFEVGYNVSAEAFVSSQRGEPRAGQKVESIGRAFFEDVIKKHFST